MHVKLGGGGETPQSCQTLVRNVSRFLSFFRHINRLTSIFSDFLLFSTLLLINHLRWLVNFRLWQPGCDFYEAKTMYCLPPAGVEAKVQADWKKCWSISVFEVETGCRATTNDFSVSVIQVSDFFFYFCRKKMKINKKKTHSLQKNLLFLLWEKL